ncbi:hypothetical protein [Arthrobacter sp. Z1-15]
MLRDVVGTFLESLTEREFDAPLIALLSSQGFTDIHFIHGSFEFGKDIIAKRVCPETGEVLQYAIQSKAGDIGLPGWREVRPQLEESEYNTRAHPNYDASLKRVAVLVTTGRLKGAAAVDAQEYKQTVEARGRTGIEFWDRLTLTDWLSSNPDSGLMGRPNRHFLEIVARVATGKLSERDVEKYTRRWLSTGGGPSNNLGLACIEAAIISNKFRLKQRLDLASIVALNLLRAVVTADHEPGKDGLAVSARRLFVSYAEQLLHQVEPLLDDPYTFARSVAGPFSIVTYPVVTMRLFEIFGLLVKVAEVEGYAEVAARARVAVVTLARKHPGSGRPVSDEFAISLFAPVLVLRTSDLILCQRYLHAVAEWILDRYESKSGGLGLGAIGDPEEVVVERLLGGSLESTQLTYRQQSFVATAVLDLTHLLGFGELHEALRENLDALDVQPIELAVAPERAFWRRGGEGVGAPQGLGLAGRYSADDSLKGVEDLGSLHDLLLMSVSRSWYTFDSVARLFR